jgi:hypothetical protein
MTCGLKGGNNKIMSNNLLTAEEQSAFDQEITRSTTLLYFYTFENAPLAFHYGGGVVNAEMSDLERRNRALTEEIYLDCYNYHCIAQLGYTFCYAENILQLPFSEYLRGLEHPRPYTPVKHNSAGYRTYDQYKKLYDAWVEKDGKGPMNKLRQEKPSSALPEWRILTGAPDRTMQLVNVIPYGNQVIVEGIVTWTENGIIKDCVFAVPLLFDDDCTVLQDRSWNDLYQWPTHAGVKYRDRNFAEGKPQQGQTKGQLEEYLNRSKSIMQNRKLNSLEKRNMELTEGKWVDAFNSLKTDVFQHERYRRQWPCQHISFKLATAQKVDSIIKEMAPDRKMWPVHIYAYGNQVVAECIISWTEKGIYKETPFISFLLFDENGLIIRDRSHINLDHFPGAVKIVNELDIPGYWAQMIKS